MQKITIILNIWDQQFSVKRPGRDPTLPEKNGLPQCGRITSFNCVYVKDYTEYTT